MEAIRVWGYLDEYQNEKKEIHQAIEEVLQSGRLVLGPKVDAFEEAFSSYCGVQYGVGVNSGTDAIFLGLKALEIGEGDEVITVANTAVPTVSAIVTAGATPVFVDVIESTSLMNLDLLEDAITPKTKCIIPVHLFGQCVNMDRVNVIAKKHGLKVLEDCAQSHGAKFNGKVAGSMSDLAAFSFYPTKILGAYGDGGMVITDNAEYAAKLKRLRFYGMETTYKSIEHGYNSRLDEIQASILLTKLARMDGYIAKRKQIAQRYYDGLDGAYMTLPKIDEGNDHAFYLYVINHPDRKRLLPALKEENVFLNVSYPWPIHLMKAFTYLGYKKGDLPITEKLAGDIFSLPMFSTLKEKDQDRVIQLLNLFV